MATPQNELYMISQRVRELRSMLHPEDEDEDIFDKVRNIGLELEKVIANQERMESILILIAKLVGKNSNEKH